MKKILIHSLFIFSSAFALAQKPKMTREEYVSKYYKLAVQEMNLYRIPASITLAQGILETESGNSDLCQIAKNHFGIKCQLTWTGMKFIKDDDTKNECFRAYSTDDESYRDHSIFLQRDRYSKLFSYDLADYRSWAYGLKDAGYATNPKYPQLLIKHIEELKLYQFDKFGYGASETLAPIKSNITKIDTPLKTNPIQISSAKVDTTPKLSPEQLKINARKEKANHLNLIVVTDSFDLKSVSESTKISMKNLAEYNDMLNEQHLEVGQNFFLEPKASGNKIGTHEVKMGQSLYDISQIYGVTVISLRKYNKMEFWQQPVVGETLFLNFTRDNAIKSRTFQDVEKEKRSISNQLKELTEKVQANEQLHVEQIPAKPFEIKKDTVKTSLTVSTPIIKVPASERQWVNHIVTAKETIFRISKNYDCKPNEILEWNNLKIENGLNVGQSLKIFTFYPEGLLYNPKAPNKVVSEAKNENRGIKIEKVSKPTPNVPIQNVEQTVPAKVIKVISNPKYRLDSTRTPKIIIE